MPRQFLALLLLPFLAAQGSAAKAAAANAPPFTFTIRMDRALKDKCTLQVVDMSLACRLTVNQGADRPMVLQAKGSSPKDTGHTLALRAGQTYACELSGLTPDQMVEFALTLEETGENAYFWVWRDPAGGNNPYHMMELESDHPFLHHVKAGGKGEVQWTIVYPAPGTLSTKR